MSDNLEANLSPDNSTDAQYQNALEVLRGADEYLKQNPPAWPTLTLTRTATEYLVKGLTTYTLPLPERLKADTVSALLNDLKEPAREEARLLEACDLSYRAVDDWDGPGQVVEVVLCAPEGVFERLQDNRLYNEIISVMTTMVCESLGSDSLERKPGEPAA